MHFRCNMAIYGVPTVFHDFNYIAQARSLSSFSLCYVAQQSGNLKSLVIHCKRYGSYLQPHSYFFYVGEESRRSLAHATAFFVPAIKCLMWLACHELSIIYLKVLGIRMSDLFICCCHTSLNSVLRIVFNFIFCCKHTKPHFFPIQVYSKELSAQVLMVSTIFLAKVVFTQFLHLKLFFSFLVIIIETNAPSKNTLYLTG